MKLILLILLSSPCFASDKLDENFVKFLNSYEKMYKGYLAKDLSTVKESAKVLLAEISEVKDEKLIKSLKFTMTKLESILKTDDLKKTHDAFNIVSQALYATAKKDGNIKGYSRYFCPMEKKYWIQSEKIAKTNNPYAVDSMPHCGSKK